MSATRFINPHSGDWLVVHDLVTAEIDRLRARLVTDLDPTQTAKVRGQIVSLSWLLALPQTQRADAEARAAAETGPVDY